MRRDQILHKVAELITKDRNDTHGDPLTQLAHAAVIKDTLGHRDNEELTDTEIEAIDHICTKLSRIVNGTPIDDHWYDIIGYAAIAAEARSKENLKEDDEDFEEDVDE